MKSLFIGGKDIGNYCLRKMIENNFFPSLVINFKGLIDQETVDVLRENNIDVVNIDSYKNNIKLIKDKLLEYKIDILVSVAFPFILSSEILKIVKYPINVHPAALPKYRGYHPLSEAFMRDDEYQGTTVHFMSETVDEGDIILQDYIKVYNEDDMVTVKNRLIELSSVLLVKALRQITENCLYYRKQTGEVIFAPRRIPEDSFIDFNKSSRYLHNFIRALVDPYPNAFTIYKGNRVNIKKSIVSNIAGTVLDKTVSGRYVVSTKDGVIVIETDQELEIGDKLWVGFKSAVLLGREGIMYKWKLMKSIT